MNNCNEEESSDLSCRSSDFSYRSSDISYKSSDNSSYKSSDSSSYKSSDISYMYSNIKQMVPGRSDYKDGTNMFSAAVDNWRNYFRYPSLDNEPHCDVSSTLAQYRTDRSWCQQTNTSNNSKHVINLIDNTKQCTPDYHNEREPVTAREHTCDQHEPKSGQVADFSQAKGDQNDNIADDSLGEISDDKQWETADSESISNTDDTTTDDDRRVSNMSAIIDPQLQKICDECKRKQCQISNSCDDEQPQTSDDKELQTGSSSSCNSELPVSNNTNNGDIHISNNTNNEDVHISNNTNNEDIQINNSDPIEAVQASNTSEKKKKKKNRRNRSNNHMCPEHEEWLDKLTAQELRDVREFYRVCMDNRRLSEVNHTLRLRLQHVRNQTFSESTKVLDSVMTYCDAKSKISKKRCTAGEDKDKFKCGNSGLCGGYTPGGWNKLRSMGLLKSNDMLSSDRFCENLTDPIKCPDVKCPEGEEKCLGRRESNNMERVEGDAVPGVPSSTAVRLDKRICGGMDKQNFRPSARLLGELAFQLERRMLDYVFGLEGAKKRRFYGYTVANICYMMEKESMSPDGQSDVIGRTEMTCRLRKLLCALEKYGYDIKIHADFSQEIINKYGLLPNPPDAKTLSTFQLNDPCIVASLISRLSKRQSEVHDLNILLNCLNFLSSCDGRTLFVW